MTQLATQLWNKANALFCRTFCTSHLVLRITYVLVRYMLPMKFDRGSLNFDSELKSVVKWVKGLRKSSKSWRDSTAAVETAMQTRAWVTSWKESVKSGLLHKILSLNARSCETTMQIITGRRNERCHSTWSRAVGEKAQRAEGGSVC